MAFSVQGKLATGNQLPHQILRRERLRQMFALPRPFRFLPGLDLDTHEKGRRMGRTTAIEQFVNRVRPMAALAKLLQLPLVSSTYSFSGVRYYGTNRSNGSDRFFRWTNRTTRNTRIARTSRNTGYYWTNGANGINRANGTSSN